MKKEGKYASLLATVNVCHVLCTNPVYNGQCLALSRVYRDMKKGFLAGVGMRIQ